MMWLPSFNHPSVRLRSLYCETLERRVLLSANPVINTISDSQTPVFPGDRVQYGFEFAHEWLAQRNISSGNSVEPPPVQIAAPLLPIFAPAGEVIPPIDLNQDGWIDQLQLLHSPAGTSDSLTINLGTPSGSWDTLPGINLGFISRCLLIMDLDGDGRLDVFVDGTEPSQGALLLGESNGTLSVHTRSGFLRNLLAADLDSDGEADFLYSDYAENRILMDRQGQVTVVVDRSKGVLGPSSIQLVDIDGDNLRDLVVTNSMSQTVMVFPGLPDGSFGPEINGGKGWSVGINPSAVAFGYLSDARETDFADDVKHDRFLDMVVASAGSNEIQVFTSAGGRHFFPGSPYKVGSGPVAIEIDDVNQDGIVDLVITCRDSNSIWILPGTRQGDFAHLLPKILDVGISPVKTFLGDFDGDGKKDLVALNAGSNTVTLFRDIASNQLKVQTISTGGINPTAGLMRDVNQDGILDLIVANQSDGHLTLLLGGVTGLSFSQTIISPGLHPEALSVDTNLDSWSFYVLDAGFEYASLVRFVPEVNTVQSFFPEEGSISSGQDTLELDFQSLNQGKVHVIPTLLALARDRNVSGEESDSEIDLMLFLPVMGNGSKRPENGTDSSSEGQHQQGIPEVEAVPQEEANAADSDGNLDLKRFLLGADEVPAPLLPPKELKGSPPLLIPTSPVLPETPVPANPLPPVELDLFVEAPPPLLLEQFQPLTTMDNAYQLSDVILAIAMCGLAWEWHWQWITREPDLCKPTRQGSEWLNLAEKE